MSIIKLMESKEDLFSAKGVTKEDIEKVEERLGTVFASDYKEYLMTFGAASVNGHEFTGIISSDRLDVEKVTLRERDKNEKVPKDLYVIEDVGIDKVLVWQNAKGELFQTIGDNAPQRMKETFAEYIDS